MKHSTSVLQEPCYFSLHPFSRDVYKAKQTVHCKQLFQPSGPGHRGLVHRERREMEEPSGGGTDGNTLNTSG